ncbi:hypothetical protein CHL76_14015 [Marinococcus halophilus]|uniref:Uncharacterized protein n=1 Tax=Marinococcus halophilus TaxID=1371 RepID=A0A510Y8W2_MARHA|nr:hypothetical protein [Marinococcus halophilus]OZT79157.1 hypothetical protein CHL76_14015 [Marinococcus halophilus]GEK59816.1 hypothetical protein MHA01_27210 [Marinococcus halophilus]
MNAVDVIIYAVCFLLIMTAGVIMFKEYRKSKKVSRQPKFTISICLLLSASLLQLIYGITTNF